VHRIKKERVPRELPNRNNDMELVFLKQCATSQNHIQDKIFWQFEEKTYFCKRNNKTDNLKIKQLINLFNQNCKQ
jgi:hypothetical protein